MFNISQTDRFPIIMIAISIILALVILILAMVLNTKKSQILHFEEIEELKSHFEYSKMQLQIDIEEQTFQNISKEIHDNIVQNLGLAKIYLLNFLAISSQAQASVFQQTVDLIADSIVNLGNLSKSLSAEKLLKDGLVPALGYKLKQMEKAVDYTTQLEIFGNIYYLEKKEELEIFRIVQEALQNILKHAEATQISIKLIFEPQHLTVSIADNGKGFCVADNINMGMGLNNMNSRSKLLNGSCTIYSMPQKGTLITLNIPNNA